MEFVAISTKPNLDIKYTKINIPVATFKSPITNEFTGLSGDYSRNKFVIGKKYKVSFFRCSKSLVDIRDAYRKEI